jgi:hypothetical protein
VTVLHYHSGILSFISERGLHFGTMIKTVSPTLLPRVFAAPHSCFAVEFAFCSLLT